VGLDPDAVIKLAADPKWEAMRTADTQAALDRGVFGAPGYVIGSDIFWGQDRLEFVERRLARG
jgi:carboxymethylenebutenolidase